jgi:hypothetical protein
MGRRAIPRTTDDIAGINYNKKQRYKVKKRLASNADAGNDNQDTGDNLDAGGLAAYLEQTSLAAEQTAGQAADQTGLDERAEPGIQGEHNFLNSYTDFLAGSCRDCVPPPALAGALSLGALADRLGACVPSDGDEWAASVLKRTALPPRDDPALHDFRSVNFAAAMLAGDDTPALSIALSDVAETDIGQAFDIDSSIHELTSLAAIRRGGLMLAYHPAYHTSLRDPTRIRCHWTDGPRQGRTRAPLHEMKNVLLGEPSNWTSGARINIFFPHMVAREQYLSHDEFERWTGVLLAAVREAAGPDVAHHHPGSWRAVLAESGVRREMHPRTQATHLATRYSVPHQHLAALWAVLQRRCNEFEHAGTRPFADPVLLLYQHGSKLIFRADTPRAAVRLYMDALEAACDLQHFAAESSYIDLAAEHFAASGPPVTLLWKTPCLERVRDQLCGLESALDGGGGGGGGGTPVSWDQYTWALTRDAAAVQYTVKSRSVLFHAGLAHGQAYNVDKNMFSTQLRGFVPFGCEGLTRLGLSEDAGHAHDGHRDTVALTQAELADTLLRSARRVAAQLEAARGRSFGVRQEVRVSLAKARLWDGGPPGARSSALNIAPGEHRAFWVLPTDEVCRFRLRAVERWVWPIVAAAARATLAGTRLSRSEQLRNCGTVTACLAVLRYSFGGQIVAESGVWLRRVRRRRDSARTEDALDVGGAVARHGVVWLRRDMFDTTTTPPVLRPQFTNIRLLRQQPHLLKSVRGPCAQAAEDRAMLLLRRIFALYAPQRGAKLAGELISVMLVRDVFHEIYKRWQSDRVIDAGGRATRQAATLDALLDAWVPDAEERRGLWGLDLRIASQVTDIRPGCVSLARAPGPHGPWREQLRAYMGIDDEPRWAAKRPFVRFFRELQQAFCDGVAAQPALAEREQRIWLDRNALVHKILYEAAKRLWVMPAANKHEWCPTRQGDGPTWRRLAFVSVEWPAEKLEYMAPAAAARRCRAALKPYPPQPARLATNRPGGRARLYAGPATADLKTHFAWRRAALAARLDDVVRAWPDDGDVCLEEYARRVMEQ